MLVLTWPGIAAGQFVWPKEEYHAHDPGVYREDPFITKYRAKFFAVFRGDVKTFEDAYKEIQALVAKNPHDARALVWLGNGQTVEASLMRLRGKQADAEALREESCKTLRRAVAMDPNNYGIYMMEAATLYVQGQYWPDKLIPRSNWLTLRDDCEHLLRTLGPKIDKVSIHVRGETYGELGVAYTKLGNKRMAVETFRKLLKSDPGTLYANRAKTEIAKLTETG